MKRSRAKPAGSAGFWARFGAHPADAELPEVPSLEGYVVREILMGAMLYGTFIDEAGTVTKEQWEKVCEQLATCRRASPTQ